MYTGDKQMQSVTSKEPEKDLNIDGYYTFGYESVEFNIPKSEIDGGL